MNQLGFQISDVSPREAGNTGQATVLVFGTDLSPGAVVSLVDTDGTQRTARSVVLVNTPPLSPVSSSSAPVATPPALAATFDLTGLPRRHLYAFVPPKD